MYCPNCGKETLQDTCYNCGTVLHNTPMNNYNNECNNNTPMGNCNNNIRKESSAVGWGIVSAICMVVATLFFPPFVGGFGIFAGHKVFKNNKIPGIILMILNGISIFVGMCLGVLVALLKHRYL